MKRLSVMISCITCLAVCCAFSRCAAVPVFGAGPVDAPVSAGESGAGDESVLTVLLTGTDAGGMGVANTAKGGGDTFTETELGTGGGIVFPEQRPAEEKPAAKEPQPASTAKKGPVVAEDGADTSMVAKVYDYYRKAGSRVRRYFEGSGWSIVIVSGDLATKLGWLDRIQAMYDSLSGCIWIDHRESSASAVLHELGHFVDYRGTDRASLSSQALFQEIYEKEAGLMASFWSTSRSNYDTASEYFAECFGIYYEDPGSLEQYCPETYAFIEDAIASLPEA